MDLAINGRFHSSCVIHAEKGGVITEESCESGLPKPGKLLIVGFEITPDRLLHQLQSLDRIDSKRVASTAFTQAINPIGTGPFCRPAPTGYADLDQDPLI
jgi:hypothetical protein